MLKVRHPVWLAEFCLPLAKTLVGWRLFSVDAQAMSLSKIRHSRLFSYSTSKKDFQGHFQKPLAALATTASAQDRDSAHFCRSIYWRWVQETDHPLAAGPCRPPPSASAS
jgi:hypothetical protein